MAVLRVTYVSPRKPQLISSPRPHGFNTAVVPGNVFRIRGWETRHCFALAREISQSSRCNAIGGREGLGVERRRGEVMSPLPRDRAVSLDAGFDHADHGQTGKARLIGIARGGTRRISGSPRFVPLSARPPLTRWQTGERAMGATARTILLLQLAAQASCVQLTGYHPQEWCDRCAPPGDERTHIAERAPGCPGRLRRAVHGGARLPDVKGGRRRATSRRFPAPWRADKIPGGNVVRDANGQALAHIYSRDNEAEALQAKVLTKDEARLALNIARLPELLGKGERET
jgi:hypothetical protein